MFKSIAEVKEANREAGLHFFDKATLEFFRSRIESDLYKGGFFITSEQFDEEAPRLYTVRRANERGWVNNASEFQQFEGIGAARCFIRGLQRKQGQEVGL